MTMRDEAPWRRGFLPMLDGLSEAEEAQLLGALGLDEAWGADADWPSWAHDGQRPPGGAWRTWVIKAGRGFGKTRAGAQWVAEAVAGGGRLRIALVGATIDETRRVMVEGESGLLSVAAHLVRDWHPSRRLLSFHTGAEARLFSGASPEALRGPEHHLAWCDELAKWARAEESWDMLQLGLRLGEAPRALVTTTPRPGPVLQRIMAAEGTEVSGGATAANPHLPEAFVAHAYRTYAGTRLGRQELDGELLPDVAGALWSVALIERCRLDTGAGASPLRRIAIGVDPPAGDGTCGIVACGVDADGLGHVLADHSVTGRSPEGWARAVAAAARMWSTAGSGAPLPVRAIAEANQGGRMVESVLLAADADLKVDLVHARDGKAARAEPVATLFEAGKVRLHGRLPALEAELCGLIAGGGYDGPGASPDRADAMVWALGELMLGRKRAEPRIRFL